jgi:hypothetical protein
MASVQQNITTARRYAEYALGEHRRAVVRGGRKIGESKYAVMLMWLGDLEQAGYPEIRCHKLIQAHTVEFARFIVNKAKVNLNYQHVTSFLSKYKPQ